MIITIQFSELGDIDAGNSDAVIINMAVDYMMENIFPEFSEDDIITPECGLICDKVSQRVYIEIRPNWLNSPLH